MAEHFFYLFTAISIVGVIANLGAFFAFSKIVAYYQEWLPKFLIAITRFGSAGAAIGSRFGDGSTQGASLDNWWVRMAIAAVASWFFWEAFQVICDHRVKRAAARAHASFDELERQVTIRTKLLTCIRGSVHRKRQRLMEALSSEQKQTFARLKKALDPRNQIYFHLERLAEFLDCLGRNKQSPDRVQNFRIGLYVANGNALSPLIGYDRANANYDPFASHVAHAQKFSLDNLDKQSVVAQCILNGRTVIVEDCIKASELGSFHFFSEQQKEYLWSIAAYPIKDFRLESGEPARAALIIDTKIKGYFCEADRIEIETFMDEFVSRLKFEWLMIGVLN